ncbi:diacylglycerol kinase family protein [Candidatus Woesebacteria bacterium]|nr:diacylglycerol kinase family protein [Candidatus Woesebacteria bacterium]
MGTNRSLLKSFSFAFEGIKEALKEEPNFRIHILIGVIALILASFLGFSGTEWAILVFTIIFVLTLELINTAIEDTVNLIGKEISKEAKAAKDVMAAAVLLGAVLATLVGLILFLPKITALI